MQILPISFTIFQICGFWRPVDWSSGYIKWLYDCFTVFISFLIITFTLSGIMDIVFNVEDLNEFTENSFMLLTLMSVCCKVSSMLCCRSEIIDLINTLLGYPCKPKNVEEIKIQISFDETARSYSLQYVALTGATVSLVTFRSFLYVNEGTLPFRAWLPYDYSSLLIFWITYLHQIITHAIMAGINMAMDTLVPGLILQTCAQLEILGHRLQSIPDHDYSHEHQIKILRECIKHHKCIFKFARRVNQVFNAVVFVQFSVSSLVLCSAIFQLSKIAMLSAQFMFMMLYIFCMLIQIFLYCWYGNEVIMRSMDVSGAIYQMDWTLLKSNVRKDLLIVMARTSRPITFTSSFLVTLSLESFTTILKTAYSAFNLLQRSAEKDVQ